MSVDDRRHFSENTKLDDTKEKTKRYSNCSRNDEEDNTNEIETSETGITKEEDYFDLKKIELGFKEFLDRSPEARAEIRDPFPYTDRDLHLNECLRVIPDPFREQKRQYETADTDGDSELLSIKNYSTVLKLFLAAYRPMYPDPKRCSRLKEERHDRPWRY